MKLPIISLAMVLTITSFNYSMDLSATLKQFEESLLTLSGTLDQPPVRTRPKPPPKPPKKDPVTPVAAEPAPAPAGGTTIPTPTDTAAAGDDIASASGGATLSGSDKIDVDSSTVGGSTYPLKSLTKDRPNVPGQRQPPTRKSRQGNASAAGTGSEAPDAPSSGTGVPAEPRADATAASEASTPSGVSDDSSSAPGTPAAGGPAPATSDTGAPAPVTAPEQLTESTAREKLDLPSDKDLTHETINAALKSKKESTESTLHHLLDQAAHFLRNIISLD